MARRAFPMPTSRALAARNGALQTSLGTIVDSFERGDISPYAGDTGAFAAVQTSAAAHHDYALECQTTTAGSQEYVQISATSGLNAYPRKGDAVEWFVEFQNTAADFVGFQHEYVDTNNKYSTRLSEGTDAVLDVVAYVNGSATVAQASLGQSVSTGTTYRIRLEWDDGTTFGGSDGDQTATVYEYDPSGSDTELASATLNEPNLDSDSAGWYVQADDSVVSAYTDWAHLTNR